MAQRKTVVVFFLKVVVAAGLIGLLVRYGALDFRVLSVLWKKPSLLAANMATWFVCSVVLASARWRVLLGAVGVRLPVLRTVALQLTALFFNVVIPGNVGGDVVKALYVARREPPERRAPILLVVVVERFVGLSGLVAMAAVVTLANAGTLWEQPRFRPMVLTVAAFTAAFLVAPALFVALVRKIGDRIERRVTGPNRLAKLLRQLVLAARLFSERPRALVTALLMSMALHGTGMLLFTLLTPELTGQQVTFAKIATVYPTGLLSVVLPIAPAGFGVGHAAFAKLFEAIGLEGGANVFNVFLLGQITPCLVGAAPYLMLRSELPTDVTDVDAAPASRGLSAPPPALPSEDEARG